MHENHKNEQYFFDEATVDRLAGFLEAYERPCCLCAPRVGEELARRGRDVRILDIDERFRHLAGFRLWDIYRPEWLDEPYDVILCDPPFFNVSLSQLFAALRTLARNDFTQPMLVSYLSRRAAAVEGTFGPFSLVRTGVEPRYVTVQESEKNRIEWFGNLPEGDVARLAGT